MEKTAKLRTAVGINLLILSHTENIRVEQNTANATPLTGCNERVHSKLFLLFVTAEQQQSTKASRIRDQV